MFGVDDAALAILAAGLASSAGTIYANRQNLKYQAKVNDVNWQIAAMNNAAQMEMANTAHQREVADLRRAGLNPILSAGGSGASTPSLSTVRGDAAQIENPANGIASSARQLASYLSDQYKADTDYAKSQADLSAIERDYQRNLLPSMQDQADLENTKAFLEKEAFDDYVGKKSYLDDNGKRVTVFQPSKWNAAKELQKEAFDSALRDSSNINWRNNLRSVGGAVGDVSSLMNGASSLMRATDALRRTRFDHSHYQPRSRGYIRQHFDAKGKLRSTEKRSEF